MNTVLYSQANNPRLLAGEIFVDGEDLGSMLQQLHSACICRPRVRASGPGPKCIELSGEILHVVKRLVIPLYSVCMN